MEFRADLLADHGPDYAPYFSKIFSDSLTIKKNQPNILTFPSKPLFIYKTILI